MATLLDKTRALVSESDSLTLEAARKHIGVSRSWMNRFVNGGYEDPGVNKIEGLFNFLSQRVSSSLTQ